jgi:hypothetical protein
MRSTLLLALAVAFVGCPCIPPPQASPNSAVTP